MSSDPDIEQLIEALQQDGPSDRDAARLRARLAGIGIATGAGIAHGTAAASVPAAKAAASAAVGLSTRWAALSLLPKMAIVGAVAATAVGGPLVVGELREHAVTAPVSAPARTPRAAPKGREEANLPTRTALAEPGVPTSAPRVDAVRAVSGPVRAPHAGVGGKTPVAATDVASAPVLVAATTTEVVATPAVASATARFVENQAPPPRASSLAEETALIDAAFAALRMHDATTAAALVAEHARRFPRGLLWRERERAQQKLSAVQVAPGG